MKLTLVAVWLTILLLKALERDRFGWWAFYAGLAGLGAQAGPEQNRNDPGDDQGDRGETARHQSERQ